MPQDLPSPRALRELGAKEGEPLPCPYCATLALLSNPDRDETEWGLVEHLTATTLPVGSYPQAWKMELLKHVQAYLATCRPCPCCQVGA
jgi:hypothetical protein